MTSNATPGAAEGRSDPSGRLLFLALAASVLALGVAVAALVVALTSDNSSSGGAAAASATRCSVPTLAEQEMPSVVRIAVKGVGGSGTGSGEVIDGSGHVLTNNHVIA